jgi:hypothetical protein
MKRTSLRPPMFSLGRLMATPAALEALGACGRMPAEFIGRHVRGDWSEMTAEDATANTLAVFEGTRVLSSYALSSEQRVWVITEADRSLTTVLLPSDY